MAVSPDDARLAQIAKCAITPSFESIAWFDILRRIDRNRLNLAAIGFEPLGQISIDRRVILRSVAGMLDLHDRRVILALRKFDIATLRDPTRVQDRLTVVREQRSHLRRTLHIETFRVLQSRRVILVLLHGNAAERVMDVMILASQKVCIVVGHQRQTELSREFP